jgi:hypothetical protein
MSKVIVSAVKRFPGTVTISDPMTFSQWMAWRASRDNATLEHAHAVGENDEGQPVSTLTYGDIGMVDAYSIATIPGVLACVEKWELENFPETVTVDTFPAAGSNYTRWDIAALLVWIAKEIDAVAFGGGDDPNE